MRRSFLTTAHTWLPHIPATFRVLVRWSPKNQRAVVEACNVRGKRERAWRIVRGKHDDSTRTSHLTNRIVHERRSIDIQTVIRFVEEQHPRLQDHCPRQRQAALHSTRKGSHPVVGISLQANMRKGLPDLLRCDPLPAIVRTNRRFSSAVRSSYGSNRLTLVPLPSATTADSSLSQNRKLLHRRVSER